MTDKTDAEVFYSQTGGAEYHTAALATIESDYREHNVMPEAQAKTAARADLDFAYRLRLDDAQPVARALVDARRSPPTVQQREAWRKEAMNDLKTDYGDAAPQALALAKARIAEDKALCEQLDRSGIGDDPRVVRELVKTFWNRRR